MLELNFGVIATDHPRRRDRRPGDRRLAVVMQVAFRRSDAAGKPDVQFKWTLGKWKTHDSLSGKRYYKRTRPTAGRRPIATSKENMRRLILVWLSSLLVLAASRELSAQVERSRETADRPAQRWLPLPRSGQNHAYWQLERLRELRGAVAPAGGRSEANELPVDQLQQLASAYEAWKDKFGDLPLPDWDSIPRELIEHTLADPLERQQAQRLLEQFARDRQLPPPGPGLPMAGDSGDVRTSALQLPEPSDDAGRESSPPTPESPSPFESSNSSATRSATRSAADSTPSASSANAPGSSTAPRSSTKPESLTAPDSSTASASSTAPRDRMGSEAAPSRAGSQRSQTPTDEEPQPAGSEQRPRPSGQTLPTAALQDLLKRLKAIDQSQRTAASENRTSGNKASSARAADSSRPPLPRPRSTAPSSRRPTAADRRANVTPPRPAAPKPGAAGQSAADRMAAGDAGGRAAPAESGANERSPFDGLAGIATSQSSEAGLAGQSPDRAQALQQGATPSDAASGQDSSLFKAKSDAPNPFEIFERPENSPATGDAAAGTGPLDPSLKGLAENAKALAEQFSKRFEKSGERAAGSNRPSAPQPSGPGPEGTDKPRGPGETDLSSASQRELQLDIKSQIEQFGVSRTLRRIVEKALKEQRAQAGAANAQPDSGGAEAAGTAPGMSLPAAPTARSVSATTATAAARAATAAARSTTNNWSPSRIRLPESKWTQSASRALRDVWQSIATAPPASRASASAPTAAAGVSALRREFHVTQRGLVVFASAVLIALVTIALLRARLNVGQATQEQSAEVRWARQVLAEGVRTRADVVRAFHRLVLRTAQPVSAWWTHRRAAARLAEATPQISTALSELSTIYEHARYMPPEIELTEEQLGRVRCALETCAAQRVSSSPA